MIESSTLPTTVDVARHYDELDPFYREFWGEQLHHGLWTTGRESPGDAALALVDEVARRAAIGPGTRVCDVGCGYGAVARRLAGGGARVTGLTLSAAQLDRARSGGGDNAAATDRSGGEALFLLRDWLDNKLPDDAFDAVIAIESLAHMADKPAALGECRRVLRPGGRLVACVWLAGASPSAWQVRHLLRPICEEGRLPGLPTAGEYLRWARAAGFDDVALDDVSERVSRTWAVCTRRVLRALLRLRSWRYLLDRRNSERRFALSVARLWLAYRTGAMRYGILTGARPG